MSSNIYTSPGSSPRIQFRGNRRELGRMALGRRPAE
jgi:hypothetical protein